MKLEQLKVMQALIKTGSVKSASELLHKTQPAISQALKALEFESGAKLFDRSGYRLELTSIGRRFYQQSLRVLEEADDLSQLLLHFNKKNEEKISIALDANTDLNALAPMLKLLQNEYPETQIKLKTEVLSGTIQMIKDGNADIGIAPIMPFLLEEEGFDYLPLYQSQLRNVATPALVEQMKSAKKVSDLRRFQQVIMNDSGKAEGVFNRNFGVQMGQRRWLVSDLATKKQLLVTGLGWGRLPAHLVDDEINKGLLSEIKLEDTHLTLDINFFAFRRNSPAINGPVASTIWEVLKN